MKKNDQVRDIVAYSTSGLVGLAICLYLLITTGKKEVWANDYYYPVGIPAMCLVIAGLSYFAPVKAWRWTVTMALGQSASMFLMGGSLSLWPLSILVMMAMSLPQFATGFVVSHFSKGKKRI